MKHEIKDIPGYEGHYKIDINGNVYSYKNKKCIIKKPEISTTGYLAIPLLKNNKQKMFSVHRLIATIFIPNPENKKCVNHKNGIKTDNRIENLEWCSYSENNLHAFRVLKRNPVGKNKLGILSHSTKPVIQYTMGNNYLNKFAGMHEAERETGVSFKYVSACCLGKQKSAKGFIWRFAND
jgi:hypothetical protein